MKISHFDTNEEVFIIAKLSTNHTRNLDTTIKTIKAAKKAGANAIEFQTYTPDSLTLNCDKEDFIIKGGLWDRRKFYEFYESTKIPYEWHSRLFEAAQDEGILCFSNPFSKEDVEFLKRFDPIAYKISCFEANDFEFVRFVAKQNRPTLISTRISDEFELSEICKIFKEEGNDDLLFLKCTYAHATETENLNLNAIQSLRQKFGVEVGLSDYSSGNLAVIMAITLGARVIERHFALDESTQDERGKFVLNSDEFKAMVNTAKEVQKALGNGSLGLGKTILESRVFARSLYASKDIKKGEVFGEHNVKSVRRSFGLHPKFYQEILGKESTCDIEFGQALKEEYFK